MSRLSVSSCTAGRSMVRGWQVGLGVLILIVLSVTGMVAGGQFGQFMQSGLEVLPFTVLAVMAYMGVDRQWGRVIAWIVMLGLLLGFALFTLGISAAALLGLRTGPSELVGGAWVELGLILVGVGLAAMSGAAGLLPGTRRALSRVLPIDPGSFVHMVGLVVVLTLTLGSLVPLLVLGQPALQAIVAGPNAGKFVGGLDSGEALRQETYVMVWMAVCSVFAVGFPVRRNLRAGLARLGLVWPTWRQVFAGIGMAVPVIIVAAGLGGAIGWIWDTQGWARTDGALLGKLLDVQASPIGAIVVGATAGLGEELAVRGVLQPRLGLLLSNAFFVSLHAFQYNADALLVVFFVGIVLGLIRWRANTTTSAITHATYNSLLFMAALAAPGWS